ncbi:MAG: MASE1 domain-containing protein [Betaproteobacteria bacterium]|nr:MASE1 domain-containing protein [Betaproteobacteria bacterium]
MLARIIDAARGRFAPPAGGRSNIPAGGPLRTVATTLGWFGANALAAIAHLSFAFLGALLAGAAEPVAPLQLHTGMAMAVLLLFGAWLFPGLVLGALAGFYLSGVGVLAGLAASLGSMAALLAVAYALRVSVGPYRVFATARAALAFAVGVYAAAVLSATAGMLALAADPGQGAIQGRLAWLQWCLGDALGMLLVAPALLSWAQMGRGSRTAPAGVGGELLLITLLMVGIAYAVFHRVSLGLPDPHLLLYLQVPLLVWLVLRFPIHVVTTLLLGLGAVAYEGTLGAGGIGAVADAARLTTVHGFIAVTAVTALVLSAAFAERQIAQAELEAREAQLASLLDLFSDWYWEQDADLLFTRVTGEGLGRSGMRPADLLGRTGWQQPIFDVAAERWLALRTRVESRRPFQDLVLRRIGADHRLHYISISGMPVFSAQGRFRGYRGVAREVTGLVAAQQAVLESVRRLQRLIEASGDPIVMKDPQGCWQVANRAMLHLFGAELVDYVGLTDREMIARLPQRRQDLLRWGAGDDEVLSRHVALRMEERLVDRDGAQRVFDIIKAPATDDSGAYFGVVLRAREITRIKQAEVQQHRQLEELTVLRGQLEARVLARSAALAASNRELEAFSYSVSHDLRAPLRALDGFSRLLEEEYGGRLDDTGRQYVTRIRYACRRIDGLIDGLLRLSRIGQAEFHPRPVDLGALALDALRALQERDPQRTVAVDVALEGPIQADPGMCRQLLEQLLDNAWKFSAGCEPARIEVGEELQDGRRVFFVRDNGAGFDMAYAQQLFAPFQRLHGPSEFEGSGIGLAIAQRIVHRHGGRIWAQSAVGQGTTVYFTLA